jgi:hypothetical protein
MEEAEHPQITSPPRAYVNFAAGQGTVLELALTLAYREAGADPLVVAGVIMPWEFVPNLIKMLQEQVESYEKEVGPIRRPKPKEVNDRVADSN